VRTHAAGHGCEERVESIKLKLIKNKMNASQAQIQRYLTNANKDESRDAEFWSLAQEGGDTAATRKTKPSWSDEKELRLQQLADEIISRDKTLWKQFFEGGGSDGGGGPIATKITLPDWVKSQSKEYQEAYKAKEQAKLDAIVSKQQKARDAVVKKLIQRQQTLESLRADTVSLFAIQEFVALHVARDIVSWRKRIPEIASSSELQWLGDGLRNIDNVSSFVGFRGKTKPEELKPRKNLFKEFDKYLIGKVPKMMLQKQWSTMAAGRVRWSAPFNHMPRDVVQNVLTSIRRHLTAIYEEDAENQRQLKKLSADKESQATEEEIISFENSEFFCTLCLSPTLRGVNALFDDMFGADASVWLKQSWSVDSIGNVMNLQPKAFGVEAGEPALPMTRGEFLCDVLFDVASYVGWKADTKPVPGELAHPSSHSRKIKVDALMNRFKITTGLPHQTLTPTWIPLSLFAWALTNVHVGGAGHRVDAETNQVSFVEFDPTTASISSGPWTVGRVISSLSGVLKKNTMAAFDEDTVCRDALHHVIRTAAVIESDDEQDKDTALDMKWEVNVKYWQTNAVPFIATDSTVQNKMSKYVIAMRKRMYNNMLDMYGRLRVNLGAARMPHELKMEIDTIVNNTIALRKHYLAYMHIPEEEVARHIGE